MSNTESLPRYNGLDGFPHVSNVEYLRTMLRDEPITWKVRYKIGTAPGMGGGGAVGSPEPGADDAFAAGMGLWGDNPAARSRRNNPFLESSVKYKEYDETIVPSRLAQLIFSTQRQLAAEWRRDMRSILTGELALDGASADATDDERKAYEQSVYARVCREHAMETAGEEMVAENSSPLRAANLDLCERLATRVAARLVLADEELPPAAAATLEAALETVSDAPAPPPGPAAGPDASEAPTADAALAGALAARVQEIAREKMDALGGHARRRGLARRWLASLDNQAVENAVVRKRAELVTLWSETIVEDVAAAHALLLRENLESQFDA